MPTWLTIIIGIAAALTAMGTVWRLLVKPTAELIVLQQRALPLLKDLAEVFGKVPMPFDVLEDIVAQFRTNGGSSLRDVVNRLDELSKKNETAAEVLKIEVETSRQLAVQDREQLARLILFLDRLTVKVDAANTQQERMEEATVQVKADLEEAHGRADATTGHPGEAADAAAQSGNR